MLLQKISIVSDAKATLHNSRLRLTQIQLHQYNITGPFFSGLIQTTVGIHFISVQFKQL
jgi:hypothetical protein